METSMESLIGEYGWLFLVGIATLLFQSTIQEAVDGIMVFLGNDYNEDDVVEVDGDPGRIVRVGLWKTFNKNGILVKTTTTLSYAGG